MFICAAGPSLDKNLHQVPEGYPLMAVNTALPVLHQQGMVADVACGIEGIPCMDHYRHRNWRTLLVEWGVPPDLWKVAEETDGLWFSGCNPNYLRTLRTLGAEPQPHGGAASTACLVFAVYWGATRIVLLGQDLAHDLERGAVYAKGAKWEGFRVRQDGDALHFEGAPERDDHRKQHKAPPNARQHVARRKPAWGGSGEAIADLTLEHQQIWFERQATRIRGVELINSTEGGVHIGGFEDVPLRDVRARLEPSGPVEVQAQPVPRERVLAALWLLQDEGRSAEAMVEALLGERDVDDVHALIADGHPWTMGLAATQVARMKDHDLSPQAKLRACYEIWRAAGKKVMEPER